LKKESRRRGQRNADFEQISRPPVQPVKRLAAAGWVARTDDAEDAPAARPDGHHRGLRHKHDALQTPQNDWLAARWCASAAEREP